MRRRARASVYLGSRAPSPSSSWSSCSSFWGTPSLHLETVRHWSRAWRGKFTRSNVVPPGPGQTSLSTGGRNPLYWCPPKTGWPTKCNICYDAKLCYGIPQIKSLSIIPISQYSPMVLDILDDINKTVRCLQNVYVDKNPKCVCPRFGKMLQTIVVIIKMIPEWVQYPWSVKWWTVTQSFVKVLPPEICVKFVAFTPKDIHMPNFVTVPLNIV